MKMIKFKDEYVTLKGKLKNKTIVDRGSNGLFSVIQMKLTDAYFHTQVGYVKVDPVVSIIRVENRLGTMDMIASIKVIDAVEIIKDMIIDKVVPEDMPAYVENRCKIDDITAIIEDRANYLYNIIPNLPKKDDVASDEIAATQDVTLETKGIEDLESHFGGNVSKIDLDEINIPCYKREKRENPVSAYKRTFNRI